MSARTRHPARRRRTSRVRARSRGGSARIAFTVTPMIDVVFLLMIYFLLVAQFNKDERVHTLDVPRDTGSAAQADPFALPKHPVRVRVRSTGKLPEDCAITTDSPLIRGTMTLDQLTLALENASRSTLPLDQRFIIAPAADTHWEHALSTLTAIEDAGFDHVRYAPPFEPAIPTPAAQNN